MNKLWLSQRNDVQEPAQLFSWELVWDTAADALQYLSDKDSDTWYKVKSQLVA